MPAIPVIALTGYLGAGKTSLLNHVLRAPGARIGVVINDFGDINVDAALVTGQVDEPVSIAGGCVCCLDDDDGLDDALEKLSDPRLALDAIIVEASGLADPVAVSRLIRFSGVDGCGRAASSTSSTPSTHFDVVDRGGAPLARYGAASLVVVNKLDQLPADERDADGGPHRSAGARTQSARPRRRRDRRADRPVTAVRRGRRRRRLGQLSFRELLVDAARRPATTTSTPRRSPRPATAASTPARCSTCSRTRRPASIG